MVGKAVYKTPASHPAKTASVETTCSFATNPDNNAVENITTTLSSLSKEELIEYTLFMSGYHFMKKKTYNIGDKFYSNRYDIEQINLCGNQDYLSRFKAELGLKFANKNVKINIISK